MATDRGALYSLVLTLTPTAEVTLGATVGHQAHAAFLRTIQQVDPSLSEALHAPAVPVRPFTVSPLLGVSQPRNGSFNLSPGQEYFLRFTLLDSAIYERFMARVLQGDGRPVLTLGRASLLLKEIRTTPGSHPWAGYTSWAHLVASAQPLTEITLEFASPTAFSFGQKAWGKKVVILPQPELVFGSLARAWNYLAPPPLQVDRATLETYLEEDVVVKRMDNLRTQMLHFQKSPQVGFLGEVTFGLLGEDNAARAQLNALADFAFYAGVGMKTTMGMGQCRRVEKTGNP